MRSLVNGVRRRGVIRDEANPWCEREIELADAIRTELAQPVERRLAFGHQSGSVDVEAVGSERRGLLDTVGQEEKSTGVVPSPRVIKPDANLQDTLIETPDGSGFGMPLVLDCLMTGVVVAGVEELNTLQESGRRAASAWGLAFGEDFAEERVEETARVIDAVQVVTNHAF